MQWCVKISSDRMKFSMWEKYQDKLLNDLNKTLVNIIGNSNHKTIRDFQTLIKKNRQKIFREFISIHFCKQSTGLAIALSNLFICFYNI